MRRNIIFIIVAALILSIVWAIALGEGYDKDVIEAKYDELVNKISDDMIVYIKGSSDEYSNKDISDIDRQFLQDMAAGLEKRWLLSENSPSDMSNEQTILAYTKFADAELGLLEKYSDIKLEDPLLDLLAHTYLQGLMNQKEGITNYYGTQKYDKYWTSDGYNVRALNIYLINRFYHIDIDPKYKDTMSEFLAAGYLLMPSKPIDYCLSIIDNYRKNVETGKSKEEEKAPVVVSLEQSQRELNLSEYSTISKGMKGQEVTRLQNRLVDLGYLNKASGVYDKNTINAVHKFQEYNSLTGGDDATAKLQAVLYSYPTVEIKIPDIEIIDIGLSKRYGTNRLRPSLMNHTNQKITAIRLRVKAYNYSGQRVTYNVLDINDIQAYDEAPCYNLEYSTFEINGLSINPNKKTTLGGKNQIDLYQFTESMTKDLYVAIIGYQTDSGRSVTINENDQVWVGSDKSIKRWKYDNNTSETPKLTKEIEDIASSFKLGIYQSYIDNFFAEVINAPMGGVYITGMNSDSVLLSEGIAEGDMLIKIGDIWVKDKTSLIVAKGLAKAGEPTKVMFFHRGKLYEIEAVLHW